jgi:hypothetical protein
MKEMVALIPSVEWSGRALIRQWPGMILFQPGSLGTSTGDVPTGDQATEATKATEGAWPSWIHAEKYV